LQVPSSTRSFFIQLMKLSYSLDACFSQSQHSIPIWVKNRPTSLWGHHKCLPTPSCKT
jgi:hypothetical protein